jgi:aspartyl aminopeptidase
LLICNDHEEVGSNSAIGAQGTMLNTLLQRWIPDIEQRARTLAQSMLISTDNAHGIHPNYSDRHDDNHAPRLNQGPAIKINASQRYASSSETVAVFKQLCEAENIPYQSFVSRNDMPCGSTIGPITATEVGVRTLDVGVPTFAMHSIRELAGVKDAYYLSCILKKFFQGVDLPAEQVS